MKKSELKELIKDELGKGAEKSKEDTNFLEDDPAAMEMLQDYEEKDTVEQADRIVEQWQILKEISIRTDVNEPTGRRTPSTISSVDARTLVWEHWLEEHVEALLLGDEDDTEEYDKFIEQYQQTEDLWDVLDLIEEELPGEYYEDYLRKTIYALVD